MAYKVKLKVDPDNVKEWEINASGKILSMEQPIGYPLSAFTELARLAHQCATILEREGMVSIEIERP